MSTLRPLPPRPSLEFEHKEAKALLRLLRAGDPDAHARVHERHPAIDAPPKLADAQLVIAREYGFASWPRLVRYFEDLERQRVSPQAIHSDRRLDDRRVGSFVAAFRARQAWAGRTVATFLPRCYGLRGAGVFEATLTEDEARLVVARMAGFSSWEDMVARTFMGREGTPEQGEDSPFRKVARAMEALDLAALQRVVAEHPDVLHPPEYRAARGGNLMASAVGWEGRQGRDAMRPVMEWLATLGFDRQHELNTQLCGRMKMKPETVRDLLERGADPDWVAPNGVPVLEHALIRYWNTAAVDVLAERAVPRKALWIAAGLGDVDGVRGFLDSGGHPTAAAGQIRPRFDLVGPGLIPSHPDPDDEEILMEAFFVAMLNGRTAVLEYMVSRGTPVNSLLYGSPMIHFPVGNAWIPVVECLVRCGADLDLRGWHPRQSAREMARETFEQMPQNADRRRIVELCGMDPDAILAQFDAKRPSPPPPDETAARALKLAADDAARMGQSVVSTENMLVGILRTTRGVPTHLFHYTGADMPRLLSHLESRLLPDTDPLLGQDLPADAGAAAAVQAAVTIADGRRRERVTLFHLVAGILGQRSEPGARLLKDVGMDDARMHDLLKGDL